MTKGNLSTNSTTSSQASSYWNAKEAADFPHLLSTFGSDWTGLAAHMSTKTPVMVGLNFLGSCNSIKRANDSQVKNYYLRQKQNSDNHWEELVNVANGKRSRGESLPVPPSSRADISEGDDGEWNEVLGTEGHIATMKYPKEMAKPVSELLSLASKE